MNTRRTFLTQVAGAAAASAALPAATHARSAAIPAWLEPHAATVRQLIDASMRTTFGWDRLAELCDTFGGRLTGSHNLELAIEWAAAQMREDGFAPVDMQPVMGPRWVRGEERLDIVSPVPSPLVLLGLGGSVATPPDGITAPLLIVRSFDELQRRAAEARGCIVLFDVPYTGYGQTVVYRATGALNAARVGAVAALVRSVGPTGLRTPHTGGMTYAAGIPEIPAAAIPVEDANRLTRMLARGQQVTLRLQMSGRMHPDAPSANVVGEIRGRELPDEVVLIGGHLDSWDVATGASDDGVGCIVTWEAARLMLAAGLRPRRTVRLVLFTNEENGLRGALAYRDAYAATARQHVFALEADSGVFEPMRLGFTGNAQARQVVEAIGGLLRPIGFPAVARGGGGADIGPIAQLGQVPTMALLGDTDRYFTIHHTPADTVDRIDAKDVSKAAAGIAAMVWVVAEMENRL